MYVVCDKTKLVGVLFEKENSSHNTTLAIVWSQEAADTIAEKHELSLSFPHNITLAIVLACMVVGRLHQHGEGKGNETGKQRQRQQGRAQCIIFGSGA